MGNNTRKTLKHVVEICDIVVMLLCFGLATIAVSHAFSDLSLKDFLSMRVKIQNILLFSGFVYIWNMVLSSFGMYESRRLSRSRDEALDIIKATSLATTLIYGAAIVFHVVMVNYFFVAIFWASVTLATMAGRFAVRVILRQARLRDKNLRRMLIAGARTMKRCDLRAESKKARG